MTSLQTGPARRPLAGYFKDHLSHELRRKTGRPEEVQVIFARRVRTDPPGGYRTRLLRTGDQVTLNVFFRHSRVKSYLNLKTPV